MCYLPSRGWQCRLCAYASGAKSHVRRHLEARHLSAHALTCNMCAATFTTENYRQIHVRTKHGLRLSFKELRELNEG